ncbi:hypothetical protein MMC30_007662 [Trapelia coarctata]|nr:hypothetical protein [Trapelia coarctata]
MSNIHHLRVTLRKALAVVDIYIWRLLLRNLRSIPYHEQIFIRAEYWASTRPPNSSERLRRQQTPKAILGRLLELRPTLEDLSPYIITLIAIKASEEHGLTDDMQKLDEIVHMYERAVDAASRQHWVPSLQSTFIAMLGMRLEKHRLPDGPQSRIDQHAQAVHFTNHGQTIAQRFSQTGSNEDLDNAIDFIDRGIQASDDEAYRARFSNSLGWLLITRYTETGFEPDIDRAIEVLDGATDAHDSKASCLNTLGYGLGVRSEQSGSVTDLERAIKALEEALELASADERADRAQLLGTLQFLLGVRARRTRSLECLDRAIDLGDKALKAVSDERNRPTRLSRLGLSFLDRYNQTGSAADLDRAIDLHTEALRLCRPLEVLRLGLLNNLGSALADRYRCAGSIDDLERSFKLYNDDLELRPPNHPDRGGVLRNFAKVHFDRFERLGYLEDLNRAVELSSEALKLTPSDHFDRAPQLSFFGGILATRWRETRSTEDLEHAIDIATEAIAATARHSSDKLAQRKVLAHMLIYRYAQDNSAEVVDRNIEVQREITQLLPLNDPSRPLWLATLGRTLSIRFCQTRSTEDINCAIQITEEAIESTPLGSPDRMPRQLFMGAWFNDRYQITGSIVDSDRAIRIAYEVLMAIETNHPQKFQAFRNLAIALGQRYIQTRSLLDISPYIQVFKEKWNFDNAPSSQRIFVAESTAYLLDLEGDWEGSSVILEAAVRLLPFASPRWLRHVYRQDRLKTYSGLASRATAYALRANKEPYEALSLLELGRGIIASSLMDLREDVLELEHHNPSLATEFVTVQDELDRPADDFAGWNPSSAFSAESRGKARRDMDKRFGELIEEIRALPGLSRYLLPPSENEMKAAAKFGPIVVITVDDFRCDAILIEYHQIRVLNLPNLTAEEVNTRVQDLHAARDSFRIMSILEWLWEAIADPCLHALGFDSPISSVEWPRLWWIPTGPVSRLPLHAAGRHMEGLKNTVLDRVVSSYSLTVRSLLYGRKHSTRLAEHSVLRDALLVAMHTTPGGLPTLQYATDEIDRVKTLCKSLQLDPVRPRQQTREEVLDLMKTSNVFHFAGHGRIDPIEPSQSSLLLEDWQTSPLTMGHLRDLRLHENPPFLAYLSACSTSASKDVKLYDEGLNLVSACQLAGFRHAIGTLWEVSDQHCVDVASVLYETVRDMGLTDGAVALGLHCAVRMLRDESVKAGRGAMAYATSTRALDGSADRNGRDLTLTCENEDVEQVTSSFWVPYIHYGV